MSFHCAGVESAARARGCMCGVSVLCSLMRIQLFLKATSNEEGYGKKQSGTKAWAKSSLGGTLQFWFITGLLGLIGPRVASLWVLEFCLRATSARITTRIGGGATPFAQPADGGRAELAARQPERAVVAPRGSAVPAAQLPAVLWRVHDAPGIGPHPPAPSVPRRGYSIRGSRRGRYLYCQPPLPVCSKRLPVLDSAHYMLRLLVVYMQEEQHRRPGGEVLLHTAVVRLGALLGLMLMLGTWADVTHLILCFLGEAACLIPSQDLLDCMPEEEGDESLKEPPRRWRTDSRPATPPELATPTSKEL
ncbi:hypothetical protein SKAU_G00172580 [Synaphobranchus kaupii]|uniref:Uncharacterized protein n=1 Tax=Synaphobranchus kaupii TaxID=118154 RepID=A0A9Q1FL09_SYNKA|nr:hypothetical protein SKAU_G00172580 [Synaphobranchus kaupii]